MLLLHSASAHTHASVLTINLPISEYFQKKLIAKINSKINNKIINQYQKLLINKMNKKSQKAII
jgi:hypothetical protein